MSTDPPSSTGLAGSEPEPGMTDLWAASDTNLVMAVARWREDALAVIYRRHAGHVFGLAKRLLADTVLAEEVTQEVFVRLWQHPDRFDPGRGSLRTFLLTMAHGRAVDLLRAETSRRRREERSQALAEASYDLEQEVYALAMAERVRDVVSALPAEERKAIELAYFGGHSYREVAALQNQPEGTVKSRIRSGLRRMERALNATVRAVEP